MKSLKDLTFSLPDNSIGDIGMRYLVLELYTLD
jgi:hypothetical protein